MNVMMIFKNIFCVFFTLEQLCINLFSQWMKSYFDYKFVFIILLLIFIKFNYIMKLVYIMKFNCVLKFNYNMKLNNIMKSNYKIELNKLL